MSMKFFEVTPFVLRLTPDVIAQAARTLTDEDGAEPPSADKEADT